nr:Fanconi anemia group F protein [Anolis sagrei ordinatus]
MEALLSQAERLPGLLEASRSPAVRNWDPATVRRALGWTRAFREAAERGQRRRGLQGGLGLLGRGPALLCLALLENRALPAPSRERLLRSLLLPSGGAEELLLPVSARRKAATQLLPAHEGSADRARAQLLLSRLREEEGSGLAFLERLPCGPTLYKAVAAALLEPGGESQAREALLPWLLQRGGGARLEAFCRLLPGSRLASLCARHPPLLGPYFSLLASRGGRLAYDPLRGEWSSSSRGGGGPEVTWDELRERIRLLSWESEPLASAVRDHLRKLKGQDGGFEVQGLSVWTDLLLDLEKTGVEEKPGRDHSQLVMET